MLGSITVVFPKVTDKLKNKWQLATEDGITHIICMPNVTKNQIDLFIEDVKTEMETVPLEEALLYY